jgi:hypothetical protein
VPDRSLNDSPLDPDLLEPGRGFVVATGIECSAPRIAGGVRVDELRKTGHWDRYDDDLALVADMGIRYVRYGIPFHVVDADPSARDWHWTDAALEACRRHGIEPIVDLLHFGVPDDLCGVGDPALPDRFARYADAFARRYPWVRWYTPVNEPLVCSIFSAGLGWWNERLRSDGGVVAAVDAMSAAQALGMDAVRQHRPDAVFVLSDACESYAADEPAAEPRAAFLNERRFVAWELALGRRPSSPIVGWLERHGVGDARLDWFARVGNDAGTVIGLDYYRGNEWRVLADGRTAPARRRRGFARLARDYHDRLGLPFMLSETNIAGPLTDRWLAEVWDDALVLRAEGRPIRGVCWYGFIDHVDWDSQLRLDRGIANPCGLVDLDRRPHGWGLTYRALALAAREGTLAPLGSTASRRYRREDAAGVATEAADPEPEIAA